MYQFQIHYSSDRKYQSNYHISQPKTFLCSQYHFSMHSLLRQIWSYVYKLSHPFYIFFFENPVIGNNVNITWFRY